MRIRLFSKPWSINATISSLISLILMRVLVVSCTQCGPLLSLWMYSSLGSLPFFFDLAFVVAFMASPLLHRNWKDFPLNLRSLSRTLFSNTLSHKRKCMCYSAEPQLDKGESCHDVACPKVENVGKMLQFRRNMSSSNEDVFFEEPIKDQTCVCTNLETILPR